MLAKEVAISEREIDGIIYPNECSYLSANVNKQNYKLRKHKKIREMKVHLSHNISNQRIETRVDYNIIDHIKWRRKFLDFSTFSRF